MSKERSMNLADLNLATLVIGHGRFLFVRLPPRGIDAELAVALDNLGEGMENMHEMEGHPSAEGLHRGRFQLLRAEPALSGERDLPHAKISAATLLSRLEAASPESLVTYEKGLRALIES